MQASLDLLNEEVSTLENRADSAAIDCVRAQGISVPKVLPPRTDAVNLLLISWPTTEIIKDQQKDGYLIWKELQSPSATATSVTAGISVAEATRFEAAMAETPGSTRFHSSDGLQVSTTGCGAVGRIAVYKSLQNYAEIAGLITRLAQEIEARIFADPSYSATEHAWSNCMALSGYTLQTHFDVTALAHEFYTNNEFSEAGKAKELALSAADANCLVKVDYAGSMESLSTKIEIEVVSASESIINGVSELVDQLKA